ncbi:phage tail protein [Chloroflexota bacterium]
MKKYGVIIIILVMGILLLSTSFGPVRAAPGTSSFDPHVTNLFEVEIDGISVGRFAEIEGLSIEQEVVEIQEGEDQLIRKVPGRLKYGDITLRRKYDSESTLNDWIEQARLGSGEYARKKMSIVLLDEKDKEIKRWNCFEAFPRSWKLITIDGKAADILVEEMVIVIDYFEEK